MRAAAILASALLVVARVALAEVDLALVLAKTYAENPRLLAARAELRATDERIPEARAGMRPHVVARSGMFLREVDTGSGSRSLVTLDDRLSLFQTVFDGGLTAARVAGAEAEVRSGRAELVRRTQEVLLEAVAAYAAVVRDQQLLERALANEQRLQEVLTGAKQRYRLGAASRTDVAQAETRWAEARALRRQAEGQLEISGAAFRRVIGDPPGALAPPELPPGLPSDLAAALAAVPEHPAYLAASEAVEAARQEVRATRAGLRPRVEFSGSYGLAREAEAGEGFRGEAAVGAVLTWPLYQGGGEYARIRRSHQLESAARLRLAEVERQLREEITAAFEALSAARDASAAVHVQLRAAELAVEGVREELRAGTRTIMDLLDAERDLFAAQRGMIEARHAEVVAGWRLLAAIGGLLPERLGLSVATYDPAAYTRAVRDAWYGSEPPRSGADEPPLDGPEQKG